MARSYPKHTGSGPKGKGSYSKPPAVGKGNIPASKTAPTKVSAKSPKSFGPVPAKFSKP